MGNTSHEARLWQDSEHSPQQEERVQKQVKGKENEEVHHNTLRWCPRAVTTQDAPLRLHKESCSLPTVPRINTVTLLWRAWPLPEHWHARWWRSLSWQKRCQASRVWQVFWFHQLRQQLVHCCMSAPQQRDRNYQCTTFWSRAFRPSFSRSWMGHGWWWNIRWRHEIQR